MHRRGSTFFNKYWFRIKTAFLFSDIIIGNSKAGLKAYHAPQKKSICVYNGFDFRRAQKIKDATYVKSKFNIQSRLVVLMVGAFGDRKDYDTFIEAAKIVCNKKSDVEFIAVGDGKNFSRISGKVTAEIKDRVKLLGKQSDVESIINASDICVLTTNVKIHGEGISNSILEYMALAKPVIATRGGGTNEIVEDERTGFLISSFNANELAIKIENLIDDPQLRIKFGKAGLEKVRSSFSIDQMVNKYISLYEGVLNKHHLIKKTERMVS